MSAKNERERKAKKRAHGRSGRLLGKYGRENMPETSGGT